MTINLSVQKCATCRYEWYNKEVVDKQTVGINMMYMATKALDSEWFCKDHR